MTKYCTLSRLSAGLCAFGLALSTTGWAQNATPDPPAAAPHRQKEFSGVLGSTFNNSTNYAGGEQRSTSASPVLGLALGRYTLSTGGGGALLDRDLDKRDSGLNAQLISKDGWRLTGSLRIDGGRKDSDEPMLRGLPEVRRTLRGRLGVVYDANEDLSLRSSWSQDLLGHQGGAMLNNTMRYEISLPGRTELTLVAGVHLASSTYMRSYFGVPATAAGSTSSLPRFQPQGGLHSTEVGFDVRKDLSEHWILIGSMRYGQLRGDARRSPLVLKPDNYSASIGLAYRY